MNHTIKFSNTEGKQDWLFIGFANCEVIKVLGKPSVNEVAVAEANWKGRGQTERAPKDQYLRIWGNTEFEREQQKQFKAHWLSEASIQDISS